MGPNRYASVFLIPKYATGLDIHVVASFVDYYTSEDNGKDFGGRQRNESYAALGSRYPLSRLKVEWNIVTILHISSVLLYMTPPLQLQKVTA